MFLHCRHGAEPPCHGRGTAWGFWLGSATRVTYPCHGRGTAWGFWLGSATRVTYPCYGKTWAMLLGGFLFFEHAAYV